jgi:hypothetical protein
MTIPVTGSGAQVAALIGGAGAVVRGVIGTVTVM